jgi:tRNA/tmRNA/rRNA uracil-C5-methylase (TrmA/RlmC/RlmD family)
VSAVGQRALKAYVVREQFARLAGLDVDVDVRELPGGLLHWRTRIGYTPDRTGRVGLRRHRSRDVEPIESCPLGVPGVGDGAAFEQSWPGRARVEVASDDEGEICVLTEPTRPAADRRRAAVPELVHGPPRLHHTVRVADAAAIRFVVAPGSFWQVHPAAAQTFVSDVLGYLAPRAGDVVLDLYAGAGLFSAAFAQAVGPSGRVVGIETSAAAVEHAAVNLNDFSWAEVRRGHIGAGLIGGLELAPDLIVLDPPRAGLGADAMTAVLGLGARAIAYVACDPASLARDVRVATERGWHLRELSAYDAFPMTHHVECIAVLTPN